MDRASVTGRRLGHRGDPARENTLEGIFEALEWGLDGVEVDVQLSLDGRPFLFHDDDLRRLAQRPERVAQMSWEQLRSIEVPGGSIADLESLLAQWPLDRQLNLEIKRGGAQCTARSLALIQRRPGLADAIVFSSFDPGSLVGLPAELRRALLTPANTDFGSLIERARGLGCQDLHVRADQLASNAAEQTRAAGLGLGTWGTRDRAEDAELLRQGLRVITDHVRPA